VTPDAGTLIVVEQGAVATVQDKDAAGTKRLVLAISGRGSILPPPHDREQLTALTRMRATVVSPEVLRGLLTVPGFAYAIAQGLLEAIRDGRESLAQLRDAPHADRLREKLIQLASRHGVGPDGVRIDLPLTHELLAQTVRSARETVTLALGELEREGFLVRDGRSYRLCVAPESLAT
jgi:CRP-like cAMP-binding protein